MMEKPVCCAECSKTLSCSHPQHDDFHEVICDDFAVDPGMAMVREVIEDLTKERDVTFSKLKHTEECLALAEQTIEALCKDRRKMRKCLLAWVS
jgi:hypothetical protein